MRLFGHQQGVRLLWLEIPEREGRGTLVEPEESHRETNGWRRSAFKIRIEG